MRLLILTLFLALGALSSGSRGDEPPAVGAVPGVIETPTRSAMSGGRALAGVWVAPSLARVGKADAVGALASAEVQAARGEVQSFQIIVQAPQGGLTGGSLRACDLTSAAGAVIPRACLTLYREHYVRVPGPSPQGGKNPSLGPGWYADALIPFIDPDTGRPPAGAAEYVAAPFSVAAGENQPLWVDVQVPRDARAGVYRGALELTTDQGRAQIPLALTVWRFAIPVAPTLRSCFLVSGAAAQNAATYRELLRSRLMPSSVEPRDERALIGAGLNSANVGLWSGADARRGSMGAPPSRAAVDAALAPHQTDLFRYAYTADEVGAPAGAEALHAEIKAWGKSLHAAGVRQLITMAPTPALFDDGTGRPAVDVWVVLPKMYDAAGAHVGEAIARGCSIWSYNSCVQDDYSPKWEIDFAPINFRIQPGFIGQSLSISGVLYWRVDGSTASPWTDVTTMRVGEVGFAGEGMLLYPGKAVGTAAPAPSMRLKWLRDGVDDYEYVEILKGLGKGDWALQVARSVGADWRSWTRDPAAVEAARRKLGEAIDALAPK